jgi:predicted transposase YdaD
MLADGLDMPDFSYRYQVIDLHGVDCEDFLRQDSPDAWVLAILCDFKTHTPLEILRTILALLLERLHGDPPRLREYVEMLEILGSNRDLGVDIEEELAMLTIDFEKLPTYRMGLKKGKEEGREEGIEEGSHNQSVAIAKNLLDRNMEPSWIASVTGLPLAEVEALANKQRRRAE